MVEGPESRAGHPLTAPIATAMEDREPSRKRQWVPLLASAFTASGVLLATAEWMAARGDTTLHFYVFWIAYFLVAGPVAWLLTRDWIGRHTSSGLIAALGVWSMGPVLLRTGNQPLYFDEFSHFRMLQDLVRAGHPVSTPGLFQIGANFPGLELATNFVYHMSGLTLWVSAVSVATLAHVALLCGVYALIRDVSHSPKSGAVGAVVYSLNPSWLFFDAQFSYETLAMPVFVWALVFALRAARDRRVIEGNRVQVLQACVTTILIAALVVIHHVTSVVAVAVLASLAIVATLQRRRSTGHSDRESLSPRLLWSFAGLALVLTSWRFVVIGHPLAVYLGSTFHVSQEFSQLLGILGIGPGLPLHSAFAGSSAPLFEIICGYAMIPVLLVAFVAAIWGLAAHRSELSPMTYVGVLLGALFFASLLLESAAAYSESVHRSWAYSFLGLAIAVGVATRYASEGRVALSIRGRRLWPPRTTWQGRLGLPVTACFVVVAIGGVALGTSTSYRFGGATAPETDPLYVGTQTAMVASWFATHTTASDVVFANRFDVRPIAVASRALIANGNEQLLLLSSQVPRSALLAFVNDKVSYIVFDRRTGLVGGVQPWFWYTDSDSNLPKDARVTIYPGRIACLDWASAVYTTNDIEVLRVDQAHLIHDLHTGGDGFLPGCSSGGAK